MATEAVAVAAIFVVPPAEPTSAHWAGMVAGAWFPSHDLTLAAAHAKTWAAAQPMAAAAICAAAAAVVFAAAAPSDAHAVVIACAAASPQLVTEFGVVSLPKTLQVWVAVFVLTLCVMVAVPALPSSLLHLLVSGGRMAPAGSA